MAGLLASLAALILVLPGGCARHSNTRTIAARQADSKTGGFDGTKVLAIARQAIADNEAWVAQAVYEVPVRHPDGSWSVVAWRYPRVPGGNRLIEIDASGKVTAYVRGE